MDNQTRAQRKRLRAAAIEQRGLMPEPYRLHKSAVICEHLLQSFDLTVGITGKPVSECIVGVYSAFPEEVQLDDFIKGLYERGAQVAFPCMMSDAWSTNPNCKQTMEMRLVSADDYHHKAVDFLVHPLKTYTHYSDDIEAYPYVEANDLTMLVVPVVAFDKDHNRLGYGGGTYDRYLTQFIDGLRAIPQQSANGKAGNTSSKRPSLNAASVLSCRIVGVAFEEQAVPCIPAEDHDIALPILSL